ncbi:MAG: hypothetical protein ACTIKT_14290, partial [Microbacterium sp.]
FPSIVLESACPRSGVKHRERVNESPPARRHPPFGRMALFGVIDVSFHRCDSTYLTPFSISLLGLENPLRGLTSSGSRGSLLVRHRLNATHLDGVLLPLDIELDRVDVLRAPVLTTLKMLRFAHGSDHTTPLRPLPLRFPQGHYT